MTGPSEALGALGSALGITAVPADDKSPRYVMVATGRDRGLLVPEDSRKAAAAGILRLSNGQSGLAKASRSLAWAGARVGGIRWLKGDRVNLVGPDGSHPGLLDHISGLLGIPDLLYVFSFGPQRPNRKPVIQILERSGRTVAFTKVGWNELTTRLVRQEGEYLQSMVRLPGAHINAPDLLHHGTWDGLTLTILSALSPGLSATIRSPIPGVEVLLDIAALGDHRQRRSLATSELATSLRIRAGAIDHESGAVAIGAVDRLISRHGDVEVELGDWHGDFGPWNIAAAGGGRLNVWDWERASGPQLVGLDLFHYHFQRENFGGSSLDRCLDESNERTLGTRREIQGPDFPPDLTAWIYLLERLLRYREPGAPAEVSKLEAALVDRLTSIR